MSSRDGGIEVDASALNSLVDEVSCVRLGDVIELIGPQAASERAAKLIGYSLRPTSAMSVMSKSL